MSDQSAKLSQWVTHYRNLGRANYTAAVVMFLAALGSSGFATVFAAKGTTAWLPWLTATPGVIVLANSFFKFESKSLWHFEKSRRLEAILRQLQFADLSPKLATDWWNKVDEEMDKKWPGFGQFSVFPKHSESGNPANE